MNVSVVRSPCQATSCCGLPNIPHARSIHPFTRSLPSQKRHLPAALPPLNVDGYVDAGPNDRQPDYTSIDSQPLNRLIYSLFRRKMVHALGGKDTSVEGYAAIIDLTRKLNALGSPRDTQLATRAILNSLFPAWLPPAFKVSIRLSYNYNKEIACFKYYFVALIEFRAYLYI